MLSIVLCVSLVYLDENKAEFLRKEILVAPRLSISPHEILTPFHRDDGGHGLDRFIHLQIISRELENSIKYQIHPHTPNIGHGGNDMESRVLQNQPHDTKWSKVLHFTHGCDKNKWRFFLIFQFSWCYP